MYVLPKWGGYAIRPEVLNLDGGHEATHRLARVKLADLDEWDATHDESGLLRSVSTQNLRGRKGGNGGGAGEGDSGN